MADKQVITKPAGRALLLAVENAQLRKDIPEIKSGDTVRLQVKVVEGNRERLQPFEGVVTRTPQATLLPAWLDWQGRSLKRTASDDKQTGRGKRSCQSCPAFQRHYYCQ